MSGGRSYLLDTNVISELVRDSPNPHVVQWLKRQTAESLYLSVISLGEFAYGIARLPAGARRVRLERWLEVDVRDQFAGRVVGFSESQAMAWGQLRAQTEKRGAPRSAVDLQIAATARATSLALVTRNVRDFAGLGLTVIDPWARQRDG